MYYDTFEDMLEDENRTGVGQLSGGGAFAQNVVGSGASIIMPLMNDPTPSTPPSAVPVPASFLFLLTALGGIASFRRKSTQC